MRRGPTIGMSLHGLGGDRKYLNASERKRFRQAVRRLPPDIRLFCLVLLWGGCRVSEALALTPAAIDLDGGSVAFLTLKRRVKGIIRQVPLPEPLLHELARTFHVRARQRDRSLASHRLWPWSRTTAWRHVKAAMHEANVVGPPASPKGLRHTFGVVAFQAKVPPHVVQRWLGHASLRTTAIYGEVMGEEERMLAHRLWKSW